MKTIKTFFTVFFVLAGCAVSAQQDILFMVNGDKHTGKVTEMKSQSVGFVHSGETLQYEYQKSDISKIQFASGRTENYNADAATQQVAAQVSAVERKGKIAVMPFSTISNEAGLSSEQMGINLQKETIVSLQQNTSGLKVQDAITTNATLAKNGIAAGDQSKTPAEIAAILGVEYVVYGGASVNNDGNTTYGSGYSTSNNKKTDTWKKNKETTKSTGNTYNSSNSTTVATYQTIIDLSFYSDEGKTIYSQRRESMGIGLEAHTATINYLVKRCPFGSKAKK